MEVLCRSELQPLCRNLLAFRNRALPACIPAGPMSLMVGAAEALLFASWPVVVTETILVVVDVGDHPGVKPGLDHVAHFEVMEGFVGSELSAERSLVGADLVPSAALAAGRGVLGGVTGNGTHRSSVVLG